MATPMTSAHQVIKNTRWDADEPASWVTQTIAMSPGGVNSYLVVTPDGDVVINTGKVDHGPRHRERYEALLERELDVRKILLTQSHPDHMGGWATFVGPDVDTIAHSFFADGCLDRSLLKEFFLPRTGRIVGGMSSPAQVQSWFLGTEEPVVTTTFHDRHVFEQGGRHFEVFSAPGGETLDGIVVWLPDERALFTGQLMGAIHGALPHLYTPRGDRQRSARFHLRDLDRVLELGPELLITGCAGTIRGSERIRADVTKVRDAVRYIHDETIRGMNDGKSLWTLMQEIELPADLAPEPGRGPVHWYVRAVWEEHVGFFRHELTTELYEVPPMAVWPEFAALAGGPERLAQAAEGHIQSGRPVHALHLLEIALEADPDHTQARAAKAAALEQLIERNAGRHYDELAWLETELDQTRSA